MPVWMSLNSMDMNTFASVVMTQVSFILNLALANPSKKSLKKVNKKVDTHGYFAYFYCIIIRDMNIQVTVKDADQVIQQYVLSVKALDIVQPIFEEACSVWDEYLVTFQGIGFDLNMQSTQTYKQELMHRQWLLDLHDETSGEE